MILYSFKRNFTKLLNILKKRPYLPGEAYDFLSKQGRPTRSSFSFPKQWYRMHSAARSAPASSVQQHNSLSATQWLTQDVSCIVWMDLICAMGLCRTIVISVNQPKLPEIFIHTAAFLAGLQALFLSKPTRWHLLPDAGLADMTLPLFRTNKSPLANIFTRM